METILIIAFLLGFFICASAAIKTDRAMAQVDALFYHEIMNLK